MVSVSKQFYVEIKIQLIRKRCENENLWMLSAKSWVLFDISFYVFDINPSISLPLGQERLQHAYGSTHSAHVF